MLNSSLYQIDCEVCTIAQIGRRYWSDTTVCHSKMVSQYVLAGTYGLPLAEVEKPTLPEVFHIDDLLDFSCEDIGGPIVGGELQLSGVTTVDNSNSANGGETSISSSTEVKSESVETVPVQTEVKTDLCVPVSLNFGALSHT